MTFYLLMSKDGLYPTAEQLVRLKKLGPVKIIVTEGKPLSSIEELKKDKSEKILAVDPDAFGWDMDGESVSDIPAVKAVFTQSTSYDWVKPEALKKLGVKVVNCAGFSTEAVAEYTIGMAMDVARKLPLVLKNSWKVDWTAEKPMLLKGKTLGVVGLGRIGTRIAEIGQGIGMQVVYWSRKTRDKRFKYLSLKDLFSSSDLIIPALVENPETAKILTRQLLDTVKPAAVLVGLNRIKQLWDEKYILDLAAHGKIGGYAFEGEDARPPESYQGNVWALPAMVWYTRDSLDNLLAVWVENMEAFARGNPRNVVV